MCIKVISIMPIILVYRYTKVSTEEPCFMAFTFSYTHKNTHIYTVIIREYYCQYGNHYSSPILMKNGYFSVNALNQNSVQCHGYDTRSWPLCKEAVKDGRNWFNWPGQPTLQHMAMLHLCQLSPSCRQWLVQWFLWEINLTCNITERERQDK